MHGKCYLFVRDQLSPCKGSFISSSADLFGTDNVGVDYVSMDSGRAKTVAPKSYVHLKVAVQCNVRKSYFQINTSHKVYDVLCLKKSYLNYFESFSKFVSCDLFHDKSY